MKILTLDEQAMRTALDMPGAVAACKEALAAYSAGGCDIPLRANLDVERHGGRSLYMPGWAPDADALGVKIVSVYPGNIDRGITSVPATMVLLDAETGQVCALMDGTWLTRLRTGAVAGAATDVLARPDVDTFALFGTGGQAETQLTAVLAVRPSIREVRVVDISSERAEEFARRMTAELQGTHGARITHAATPEEAMAGAAVVTTVTTATSPVFDGSLLAEGAHLNAVGSYTPQMCEVDPVALLRADKIYCDTRDALVESGDIQVPLEEGRFDLDRVTGELGDVLLGRVPGRESASEITFFECTGSAVLDVVVGRRIYETALATGAGTSIDL